MVPRFNCGAGAPLGSREVVADKLYIDGYSAVINNYHESSAVSVSRHDPR